MPEIPPTVRFFFNPTPFHPTPMKPLSLLTVALIALLPSLARAQYSSDSGSDSTRTIYREVTTTSLNTSTSGGFTTETGKPTAIVVANRAGADFAGYIPVLEDFVQAEVDGAGFEVISPESVLQAVSNLEGVGRTELDQTFSESTTAVRLADTLGARYILLATISSFGSEKRVIKAYGVDAKNQVFRLRGTYRVLDGTSGATLTAEPFQVEKVFQDTEYASTSSDDFGNELMSDAAKEIGWAFSNAVRKGDIRDVTPRSDATVNFYVQCTVQDMRVPDVVLGPGGDYQLTTHDFQLEQTGVTVELDGIAIGTSDSATALSATPGIHRIRLTREGFEPWERTVNVRSGLRLNVALQMSPEGHARWMANTQFLQNLKADRALTAAEVEQIRGLAQMFRQSGIKIDIQGTELPDQIIQKGSLFSND